MSGPGVYDFSVYQGDTKKFSLVISAGPPPSGPYTPVDLTGCTILSQIRATPGAAQPEATITCAITDAVNGEVLLSMAPAVTAAMTAGSKVWDMEITFPSGDKYTYLKGAVTVVGDVTRAP
jgi:hypothetical protein